MATLEQRASKTFHIIFWFNGQRFKRSLKTKDAKRARDCVTRLDDTIHRIETGQLTVPHDVDIADFLLSQGQRNGTRTQNQASTPPPRVTLKDAFAGFFESIPDGNLEENTLACMHLHKRHLLRVLKARFPLATLQQADLQTYVNKRSKEKTRSGGTVCATTIRKELVTLGTMWRWAETQQLVDRPFPRRGVRLPKTKELPPFQTWQEIERQIQRDELTEAEASLLWDALYLRRSEIDELLVHVKDAAYHPFIYPMVFMAAHTGARRSELLRSRCSDFDFEANSVTIHEKKRTHGRTSTRRVPLSPALRAVMLQWIDKDHPGGNITFCLGGRIARSRIRVSTPGLTPDQAQVTLDGR